MTDLPLLQLAGFGAAAATWIGVELALTNAHRLKGAAVWRRRPQSLDSDGADGQATLELPWRQRWDFLPKRSAGRDFSRRDYEEARRRAREVARATLGDDLWEQLQHQGYLDLRSRQIAGVTYRLRVGRRIEVRCDRGVEPPWSMPYLCINPTYPLPEEEFFAQLYLYVRDREEMILAVAAPQPWDQRLGRTF